MRRIASVTQRFHELKGLQSATFGAALIFAGLVEHSADAESRSAFSGVQALVLANCIYVLAIPTLERGYRHIFGDAVGTRQQKLQSGLLAFVVVAGGMMDAFVPLSGVRPSFMAVGFACCASWILLRDWRWRIHYVAALAAGVAAAIVTASVPAGSSVWTDADPVRAEAYLLAGTLIGLALVWAGVCDHRLLAASLGGGAPATPRRRPLWKTSQTTALAVVAVAGGGMLLAADARGAALMLPLVVWSLLIVGQVFIAVPAAFRGIREFRRDGRVSLSPAPDLHLRSETLNGLLVVALAAAVESTFAIRGLLALTLAAAIGWAATRRPHQWPYDLAASSILAGVGVLSRHAAPAKAFGMLMIAVSLAAILEGLSERRSRITDAHTL